MKRKLYCIIGRTGTGKDTAVKVLQEKGLKAVCSYTTRNMRDNETNGIEHYFITREEMDEIKAGGHMVAYTQIGDIEYCATSDELFKSDIYVIDPLGLYELKRVLKNEIKNGDLEIISIYIYAPSYVRHYRIANSGRGDTALEQFETRCKAEDEQFNLFESNGDIDVWIHNDMDLNTLKEKILSAVKYL